MACKTCDHTMQRVNDGNNPPVYWCPRCGSIKSLGCGPEYVAPVLVARTQELIHEMDDGMRQELTVDSLLGSAAEACGTPRDGFTPPETTAERARRETKALFEEDGK